MLPARWQEGGGGGGRRDLRAWAEQMGIGSIKATLKNCVFIRDIGGAGAHVRIADNTVTAAVVTRERYTTFSRCNMYSTIHVVIYTTYDIRNKRV